MSKQKKNRFIGGAVMGKKGENSLSESTDCCKNLEEKDMEKESITQEQDKKVINDVEKDGDTQVLGTSASFTEKIDFSPVINTVDSAEKRLNNNLNVSTQDILKSIKAFRATDVDTIKKYIESENKFLDGRVKQHVDRIMDKTQKTSQNIMDVEKRLNNDLSASTEDILQSMMKYSEDEIDKINQTIISEAKSLDGHVKQYVDLIVDRTQKTSQNIIDRVNTAERTLKEEQEKIGSKMISVDQRVNDIGESIESIEGSLQRLDQLNDIVKLLQNKGLVINMEIPPINAEEEDIVNLVRYSQKITEQLGYAARDLIRKQAVFKSQAQSNANEQNMMEQKIAVAHEEGVKEGKKIFIKQLISKYADVDAIKDSEDSHVHAIWVLLEELGVEIDGDGLFLKGQEVTFDDEEVTRITGIYNGVTDGGTYKVLKTGLVYHGEIIYKSEFEKMEGEKEKVQIEKKQEQEL